MEHNILIKQIKKEHSNEIFKFFENNPMSLYKYFLEDSSKRVNMIRKYEYTYILYNYIETFPKNNHELNLIIIKLIRKILKQKPYYLNILVPFIIKHISEKQDATNYLISNLHYEKALLQIGLHIISSKQIISYSLWDIFNNHLDNDGMLLILKRHIGEKNE